jgi:FkbM family methyltransferase
MYEQKKISGEASSKFAKHYFIENIAGFNPLAPIKINGPIVLYGAGDMGIMAYQYFEKIGLEISFVVDQAAEHKRYDEYWRDKKILSPKQFTQNDRMNLNVLVCIANYSFSEIYSSLKSDGWENIYPLYDFVENFRNLHPLSNGWFSEPFSSSDVQNICVVLESLADDESRAHHLQFLAWRCLREDLIFENYPVEIKNRFFIKQITEALTENEDFLDLGAYQGKVILNFLSHTNYKYKNIYAIDGDESSLEILKRNLKEVPNLKALSAVLAASCGQLKFSNNLGYVSQVSSLGSARLATTLDQLDTTPTYIKMHLEGYELNVLHGGINTISKYRPMMAITAYHNSDGIFELLKWLINNLDNYKIYTRLHSWCGTGYVIYCMPVERL